MHDPLDKMTNLVEGWQDLFINYADDWGSIARPRLPENWASAFAEAVAHQDSLVAEGKWRSGPRSLLGVIGVRHLEQPHSSVLAWLLDPNGTHDLGDRFLTRFLVAVGLPRTLASRRIRVVTEEPCSHPEMEWYGFTDVVVRGDDWTLVIENKLWAQQSGEQLDLYFEAYGAAGAHFVYLTPDGTRPRSPRPEVVDAFRSVSWRRDMIPSLRLAIAEAASTGEGSSGPADYLIALEEELR